MPSSIQRGHGAQMKVVAETNRLADALALLGSILDAKPVVPVLATMKIEGMSGQISMASHSLDRCMSVLIPAEVTGDMIACVPLAQLASIVQNSAKGSTVIMEIEPTKAVVKIGRGRYQLPVVSADDFPAMFAPEGEPLEISSG